MGLIHGFLNLTTPTPNPNRYNETLINLPMCIYREFLLRNDEAFISAALEQFLCLLLMAESTYEAISF